MLKELSEIIACEDKADTSWRKLITITTYKAEWNVNV
jgi:hypothetical protein